jgi:hypothetical protein
MPVTRADPRGSHFKTRWAYSSGDSHLQITEAKRTGGVAQAVQCLLCKCEALSLNSSHSPPPTKKKKKKRIHQKTPPQLGHTCNSWTREAEASLCFLGIPKKPAPVYRAGGVTQLVERLPSKRGILSSNSSTAKIKERRWGVWLKYHAPSMRVRPCIQYPEPQEKTTAPVYRKAPFLHSSPALKEDNINMGTSTAETPPAFTEN